MNESSETPSGITPSQQNDLASYKTTALLWLAAHDELYRAAFYRARHLSDEGAKKAFDKLCADFRLKVSGDSRGDLPCENGTPDAMLNETITNAVGYALTSRDAEPDPRTIAGSRIAAAKARGSIFLEQIAREQRQAEIARGGHQ